MNDIVLRVSALSNRIYLGKLDKKHPGSLADKKRDVTDEAVLAVFQFMQSVYAANGKTCIKIDGHGRLRFEPWDAEKEAEAHE